MYLLHDLIRNVDRRRVTCLYFTGKQGILILPVKIQSHNLAADIRRIRGSIAVRYYNNNTYFRVIIRRIGSK